MTEPSHELYQARKDLMLAQYASNAALRQRWEVDKLADEPVNMQHRAVEELGLLGTESVLDVGCHDGQSMDYIREKGHTGLLKGVDNMIGSLLIGDVLYVGKTLNTGDLIAGDAEALPFVDDSFDALLCLFVLYHVVDIEKALREIQRVTRPGSSVVIGTSYSDNKFRTRQLEKIVRKHLNMEPGERFTESFTSEIAKEMLPDYFSEITERSHRSPIHLKDPRESPEDDERMITYRTGLRSYVVDAQYYPPKRKKPQHLTNVAWEEAVNKAAWPVIAAEIEAYGSFEDLIHRSIFVCRNDK